MKTELWKNIVGYKDIHIVSNLGLECLHIDSNKQNNTLTNLKRKSV